MIITWSGLITWLLFEDLHCGSSSPASKAPCGLCSVPSNLTNFKESELLLDSDPPQKGSHLSSSSLHNSCSDSLSHSKHWIFEAFSALLLFLGKPRSLYGISEITRSSSISSTDSHISCKSCLKFWKYLYLLLPYIYL